MPSAGPSSSSSSLSASKKSSKNKKGSTKNGKQVKHMRRVAEETKFKALQQAVNDYTPSPGSKAFSDLPISDLTKKGLKKAFFVNMTDVQAQSIPISLKGHDVLGAARTGSGKTLAFLIPILETLYRAKWGPQDGLGAIILSPTRELAMQIFDVLRSIGGFHSFSAGLVIGGKNLKDESERLQKMNILVATPGRLLQHMDQTVGFEADNLQMLVLDEADRILDMGFARALNAIVGHLPKTRQTLLFSATQTDSVKDLARLSLRDPKIISVREETNGEDGDGDQPTPATPKNLSQHYLVCPLEKKLDVLFSFIKTHLNVKVLVFMSSRKQVQFVYSTFCKLHPGTSLLALHGTQKQTKRLDIFQKFTSSKASFLFATDIAARGLDFPSVDWVVQLDCPEDAETYIHRVGRTARYESKGQALTFLLPSEEEGMVKCLEKKGIKVEKIKAKESKIGSVREQLQSFCFQDPEIKYLGQKAFVSYVRSVYLHKDKSVFKVDELPLKEFAASLGLPGAPKVKFVSKAEASKKKNAQHVIPSAAVPGSSDDESEEGESDEEETSVQPTKEKVRTKYDRMFERKNQNILSEHYSKLIDPSSNPLGPGAGVDSDDDDEFITLKRANHELPAGLSEEVLPITELQAENMSKRAKRALHSKKAIQKVAPLGKKILFDEEGNAHDAYEMKGDEEFTKGGEEGVMEKIKAYTEGERERMKDADVKDKEFAREKKQEKKRKRKEKERIARDEERGAVLAPVDDFDGYISPEFDLSEHSSDDDDNAPPPPPKRRRAEPKVRERADEEHMDTLMDEEEMALQLLRGGK